MKSLIKIKMKQSQSCLLRYRQQVRANCASLLTKVSESTGYLQQENDEPGALNLTKPQFAESYKLDLNRSNNLKRADHTRNLSFRQVYRSSSFESRI
jgi:hypothetical protein